ncbi:hypothetical protein BDN72DRAFT_861974 [Pluteus cervinus]|uniref:Uncharacterized protein n=1 Tax=Pluteus cervinus TaxID=181527 RepID=A0ACD3ADV1_9AGAR|nr:hypothetical protein BDN72DRAFT_861974 [Pluteus cervinus]
MTTRRRQRQRDEEVNKIIVEGRWAGEAGRSWLELRADYIYSLNVRRTKTEGVRKKLTNGNGNVEGVIRGYHGGDDSMRKETLYVMVHREDEVLPRKKRIQVAPNELRAVEEDVNQREKERGQKNNKKFTSNVEQRGCVKVREQLDPAVDVLRTWRGGEGEAEVGVEVVEEQGTWKFAS